jgi:hypothetical protein
MTGMGSRFADIERAGYLEYQTWEAPVLGSGRTAYTFPAQSAAQDVDDNFVQPDVPRNVVATIAASTAAHVAANSVVVYGTDYNDEEIDETLTAFTADTPGAVTGLKAFKTITRIVVPAQDGATAQVTITYGAKLGLKKCLAGNTSLVYMVDGVKETTLPTVAFSKAATCLNTVTFNTAANGTRDFVLGWLDMRVDDISA